MPSRTTPNASSRKIDGPSEVIAWRISSSNARAITGRIRSNRTREACDKLIGTSEIFDGRTDLRQSTKLAMWISSSDRNITWIEGAEILPRQHCAAVFRLLEIEVNELMHGAAMKEAQHFA